MKKFSSVILTIAVAYLLAYYNADEKIRYEKSSFIRKIKYFVTGELDTTDVESVFNQALYYQSYYNFKDAIGLYEKAIELDPDYDTAYYYLAHCYLELNDTLSTIETLNKLIDQKGPQVKALNILGKIYLQQGKLDKAEAKLTQSMQLSDSFASTYYYLSKVYFQKNDLLQAEVTINKAIKIDQSLDYMELLRRIYLKTNKNNEADKIYQFIKNKDPDYYPDYKNYAKNAEEKQEYQKAANYYTLYLSIKPDDEDVIRLRGWVYINLKKYDSAYYDFNRLIEIDSKNFIYYFGRAYTYDLLDSIQKAIEDYFICLIYNPEYHYAYNNIGYEYYRLNDYDNAIKYYKKCTQIKPDYFLAYANIGWSYWDKKNYAEALKYFKKSYSLKPENKNMIYYIAKCYDEIDDKLHALDYYNEYIRLQDDVADSTKYNFVIKRIAELSKE